MSNLRVLGISYNNLEEIEDLFSFYLNKLEVIDASNNKLYDVSSKICFFNNVL